MRVLILALAAALVATVPAAAQQEPDSKADVSVARPAFAKGSGPVVGVDSGHRNFHTIDGRYGPFAALLSNDGFQVVSADGALTAESLSRLRVLVIANPLPEGDMDAAADPQRSAYTPEEIAAVKAWVEAGGSLFLIADHMPFAGAASEMASAFGFSFTNGYAQIPREGPLPDIFSVENGYLHDSAVTRGRSPDDTVTLVGTFTGSAFTAPEGAVPVLILRKGATVLKPDAKGELTPDGPRVDVGGQLQGAILTVGEGRVAVFGEAGMFSAQVVKQRPGFTMGFNNPAAPQNRQFLLNIVRWLAGA